MRLTSTPARVTHTTAQSMRLTTQHSTSWSLRHNQLHEPPGATVLVSGVAAVGRSANMMAAALISSQADAQSLLLLVMVTMLARTGDHGRVAGRGGARAARRRVPAWRW